MKNINIKKVVAGAAALAVGASFLGAAVAAQVQAEGLEPIVKNDIIGANGMPTGTIVVGSLAQPIDVMWAGNIAAAIGAKAYTTTTHTTDPIEVPGTPGTSSTITGDGYLFDKFDFAIDAPASVNIDKKIKNSDYSVLFDDTITGNSLEGDSSYDLDVTETIKVEGKTFFSTNRYSEQFVTSITNRGITYEVAFNGTNGIDYNSESSVYFKNNDSTLDIKFMGRDYSIQSITDTTVKLIEEGSKQSLQTGSTVELTGSDDTPYTLEIGNAYDSGSSLKILITLKSNGSTVASGTFKKNDDVKFTGITFNEKVTVTDILDDTSSNNVDLVELTVGMGGFLELKEGEALPGYKADNNDRLWTVNIDTDTTNKVLNSIKVYNDVQVWDDLDLESGENPALTIGEKAELPLGLGSIDFLGLSEETSYNLSVGNDVISWIDYEGASHEVSLYWDNVRNRNQTIDGQSYYFKLNGDYLEVYNKSSDNTLSDKAGKTSALTGDANIDVSAGNVFYVAGKNDLPITLWAIKEDATTVRMALAGDTYSLGDNMSATWKLIGTTNEDFDLNQSNIIDLNGSTTYFNGTVTDDGKAYAIFEIDDKLTNKAYVFLDPYTGDLARKGDYDNMGYVSQVIYDLNADYSNGAVWKLDQDDAKYDMDEAYTLHGTLVKVDGSKATFTMPERKLQAKVFVGGGAETVIEEGQPGSTIPGTTYTTITPANIDVRNLVKMDNAGVGGVKIIVGGHLVNTLAQGITDDYLTQAGQWVLGKNTEGNMIVAGFTAQDTADAAGALISIIMG